MGHANLPAVRPTNRAWNRDRVVGQKRPLLPRHVWAIRVLLEISGNIRDLALFNLAIDSKLRGCDLVRLRVRDVISSNTVKERASVIQQKTSQPVRFEITEGTRRSLMAWLASPAMAASDYLWPGRLHNRAHISTRQYALIVKGWVTSIGLEPWAYGTHTMRRTKVAQIYRKTGNLRAALLHLSVRRIHVVNPDC
ncbi:tyrosine-type recombinase/integrase [Frigidibacter sp. MR17.14]|uniref:tyrosine-type recombinase/integrase n=1 Tax=Frigidibacter sp. MR17.14 TaxID=3126509 RepID=UPI0030130278